MNKKRILWVVVLTFLCAVISVNMSLAQGKDPGMPKGQAQAPKITMQAKILPDTHEGYKAISIKPHEEYKIINVDEKILAELAKKGEPVTIEGSFPRGSMFFLAIEKINGKDYPGKK